MGLGNVDEYRNRLVFSIDRHVCGTVLFGGTTEVAFTTSFNWVAEKTQGGFGMSTYVRNIDQLQGKAVLWWPDFLCELEASISVIPVLVRTQERFISILNLCGDTPEQVFDVLASSKFPANLFLKHLIVLSDFGGEQLQRINNEFKRVFLSNDSFDFVWHGDTYSYNFKALPIKGRLSNKRLKVDTQELASPYPMDDLMKDVTMILLFGASAVDSETATILSKCLVGDLIGQPDMMDRFVKERYIYVSRITGGAQANSLGQVAQNYLAQKLGEHLGNDYEITNNGHIDGVTQNDGKTLTTFDITVTRGGKAVAIEVSFQETTNSTIERKAGQAKARYDMVNNTGNYIAYVIDGAGNFQRVSAISTICQYSHCTVAYSDSEFEFLANFIKEKIGQ